MNTGNDTLKNDPQFFYGPLLSVKFNDDFNLTFVYLYANYDLEYFNEMKRYDSDLALNYRLNDYLKIFAGIKYLGFKLPYSDMETYGYGPGLGLSATFPIADNLFLIGTLSGFYLWNKTEYEYSGGDDEKDKVYGFNSTLSIAYYIAPASTVISLGGRYQYFKQVPDEGGQEFKNKFYGITLSATYSFNI